jgi:hypothetical protein
VIKSNIIVTSKRKPGITDQKPERHPEVTNAIGENSIRNGAEALCSNAGK